ncbi:hypothetical protein K469DRAFT_300494 [Zopfia rhizophila CBS 207.26]|uniref:Uncharacterized protein n=1 Tax=Zopfia rhizophila CBS 207.26 TaxID=1314779 RepID=A0A6A6DMM0_9PEZI|nr:hypothetical protein K469DRAFT_300494 [Zopfia rhizophila CBS 207.26]
MERSCYGSGRYPNFIFHQQRPCRRALLTPVLGSRGLLHYPHWTGYSSHHRDCLDCHLQTFSRLGYLSGFSAPTLQDFPSLTFLLPRVVSLFPLVL